MADFALRIVEGNATGTEFPLGQELLLGRGAGKPGNLGSDATLSRRHARIYKTDDGDPLIEDLGSHNGTLVNGQAVDMPVGLSPGDRIEVGETTLELILVVPPPAAETGRTRVSHRVVSRDPPPAVAGPPPAQPTRLGPVPPEVQAQSPRDLPTRLGQVPMEAAGQPTRIGAVPAELAAAKDQPTRLGRVPVEPAEAKDQPTRLGRVPVEAAAPSGQATRGGRVAAEPPVAAEDEGSAEAETPRRPWWKRILGGSR